MSLFVSLILRAFSLHRLRDGVSALLPFCPMASAVTECFGGESLYVILGVAKDATADVIKRAFYKKALLYHPDKNPAPEATKKFQALSFIHSVLSEPAKRKQYDATVRNWQLQLRSLVHTVHSVCVNLAYTARLWNDVHRNNVKHCLQGSLADVDEGDGEAFDVWYEYWRSFFPLLTTELIEEFEVRSCIANGP